MPVKNYLQALFYLICRYTVEHSIAPIISSNVSLCSMVFCYGRKLYIYNIYYICMCIYIYEHIHIYYICYIYMLYEYMLYIYIYIYLYVCTVSTRSWVRISLGPTFYIWKYMRTLSDQQWSEQTHTNQICCFYFCFRHDFSLSY